MKICVIGLRGIPEVMGGIETHCEQIYPRIAALSDDNHITVLARSPYVKRGEYSFKGVSVVSLWTIRNKYLETILHTIYGLIFARFSLNCDIVHIHGIGPALTVPLARALGLSVIITHHGEDYQRKKWNALGAVVLRAGEAMCLTFAHRVIAVSEALSRRLKEKQPSRSSRIVYIPNGADHLNDFDALDDDSTSPVEQLGLAGIRYILAVGRLVPEKGFDELIAAYIAAKVESPLVIVGAADHSDRYAQGILRQRHDRIIFAGYRPRAAMLELYKHAGLFVSASSHEGLPIAALEAASSRVPILLSDIEPHLELGFPAENYFPLGNIAVLAQRLRDWPLEDCARYPDNIGEKYSWEAASLLTADQYQGLLQERARPH